MKKPEEIRNEERGHHFLSGFGNESFIKEFYTDQDTGLKPGTILSENEDQYKLEIGIPFLNKKDIKLDLIGNKLTLHGIKSTKDVAMDVSQREFVGEFYIPDDVKKNEIDARFEDGLLTVTLPKMKMERFQQSIYLN